jgi:serine/threonine protein kinase
MSARAQMSQDSRENVENAELSLEQSNDKTGLPDFEDTTINAALQPPVVLEPGQVILDKFRIIELLGRGGMGSVYRVEHLMVNRMYALKCLSKTQTNDAGWRRFQNEAKAAHMLDHANLIRVYEFGLLPGGQPFFLMELVEGPTLSDEVKRLGHLPLKRALRIFIHVAFAIQYAHEHKVIHRDLKPSNIMLAKSQYEHEPELVKVVDFGIAKLTGVDEFNQQTLTKTGEIFGSPLYMSPEQCIGVAVDHRSDLYSLGCVFYETLTGAPPFIGDSALSTMMKHQTDRALSLKEASLGNEFPQEMDNIIEKTLHKDPNDRYQSAQALAEDLIELEKVLDSAPVPAFRAALGSAAQKLEAKKTTLTHMPNPFAMLAFGALTFVLGLGLSYLLLKQEPEKVLSEFSGKNLKFSKEERKAAAKLNPVPEAKPVTNFFSTKKGQFLEFRFPQDKSLGLIEQKNGTQRPARGLVKVPLGEPIGLRTSDFLLQNPHLMEGFRPDDLSVLDFGGSRRLNVEIFPHLERLTGLVILNVSGTEFGDAELPLLKNMTKLRYLNLATTNVSCQALLKSPIIDNLNCLDVTCTDDAKLIAAAVYRLPNLRQLVMGGALISDADMKNLARSKSIKVLCLASNMVTDKGIAQLVPLKTLEWLDLSSTNVKLDVRKYAAQMPNLRILEMGNMFGEESREEVINYLSRHRPHLKILWMNTDTHDLEAAMPEFVWHGDSVSPHIDFARIIAPSRQ